MDCGNAGAQQPPEATALLLPPGRMIMARQADSSLGKPRGGTSPPPEGTPVLWGITSYPEEWRHVVSIPASI
jgi:hypothetical protein